ncbi:MAG: heavy metal translocating P-type ATPase [Burkholderiaceae bacterium]
MTSGGLVCLHCAEPVPVAGRHPVLLDSVPRDTCCAGCQAVAQAIIDAGLARFYEQHRVPGRPLGLPAGALGEGPAPPGFELYDAPEFQDRYVHPADGTGRPAGADPDEAPAGQVCVDLTIEGMHCGACVWLLEQGLRKMPGVQSARINFTTERARVRWDPRQVTLSALLGRIGELGYAAMPFDASRRELAVRRQGRRLLQRLFIAGLASMQAMMFALPGYLSGPGDIETAYRDLLQWAGLVLAIPVLGYSAWPFFAGAWRDLRARSPGMDVPVAIGMSLAFLASLRAVWTGEGEVYFDSIAMFAFLLLGARYLEWLARRRAAATLDGITATLPEAARRLVPDPADPSSLVPELIPAARLRAGDLIEVHLGEPVPADARLLDEHADIDQSLLTGESEPVAIRRGSEVAGGALLASAPARFEVLRAAAQSTLSVIGQLAERGARERPAIGRLADRVASVFVTLILLLATAVWFVWRAIDPGMSWPAAIAVLVVSCPCALSLATPTALAAAHADCLRRRLLLGSGEALETLSQVTDVVLDKTGTLTEGRPTVSSVGLAAGAHEPEVTALAVAMARGSAHPLAGAIAALPSAMPIELGCRAHQAGAGLEAIRELADGRRQRLRLGSAGWCGLTAAATAAVRPTTALAAIESEVWLSMQWLDAPGREEPADDAPAPEFEPLARFGLTDPLREGVAGMLDRLRARGLQLHLVSGDREAVVEAVAGRLALARWRAGTSPDGKQQYVKALQAQRRVVLMVGDGINDLPALASADVSVAFGQPTALAKAGADVVLLNPQAAALDELIGTAARVRRVIYQNLGWAIAYNAAAIPLAAMGYVPPWLAAIGMALSSLLVVGNSARLLSLRRAAEPAPARATNRVSLSLPS